MADDGLASDATPDQIKEYIRSNFPDMGYLLNNDEVLGVIVGWVRDDAPDSDLQARIRTTQYFQHNGPAARQWDELQSSDPEAAGQKRHLKFQEVSRAFSSNGFTADGDEIYRTTEEALRMGWTGDELLRNIISRRTGQAPTTAKADADQMVALAGQYGVPMDRATAAGWATKMMTGELSSDSYQVWVKEAARNRWVNSPEVVAAIDKGITPTDYFAPLRSTIAQTLELPPESVDVFAGQFGQATSFYDDKAKVTRAMTIPEARQLALRDDRVKQTDWYKKEDASWSNNIARAFNQIPGG